MAMDHLEKAKAIIEKVIYINIATVTPDGRPWNTPVVAAYDEDYNFYWASWAENEHSKNIRNNPNVFLTIYDSTVPEGTGEGVYIEAKAVELTDRDEIARAVATYYARKNRPPRQPEEFMGDYPRRVYKAVPRQSWVNVDGDINGNYVDQRVEIELV